MSAMAWVEKLRWACRDPTSDDMGIDANKQLKTFDFDFVMHCSEEGFGQQVLDDFSTLATCIHVRSSGIEIYAKASNSTELERIEKELKSGQGVADGAVKNVESIIQAGWTGANTSFSSMPDSVTAVCADTEVSLENPLFEDTQLDVED
jgi:hypothetical protein